MREMYVMKDWKVALAEYLDEYYFDYLGIEK